MKTLWMFNTGTVYLHDTKRLIRNTHHEEAAKQHTEANKSHLEGYDKKAAHHAQIAKGHTEHAGTHACEADKKQTEKHGTKK